MRSGHSRRMVAAGMALAGAAAVTLAGAQPALATPSCAANYVCLWEDASWTGHLVRAPIPVSDLYDCKWVSIPGGRASSGQNNTKFAFDLVYINPKNESDISLIGTMAPYKAYAGFGAGNDKTNFVMSPGCEPVG